MDSTDISFAFPLTSGGSAFSLSTQKVCAFLPVRDYGFRFVVQVAKLKFLPLFALNRVILFYQLQEKRLLKVVHGIR